MSHPEPSPTPRPGPPGFIPIVSRPVSDPSHLGATPPGPAYLSPTAYLGAGGTARALADAERNDALVNLIETADRIASHVDYVGLRHQLNEAAARARLAFGIRKS